LFTILTDPGPAGCRPSIASWRMRCALKWCLL
jgi:hypothetical protein